MPGPLAAHFFKFVPANVQIVELGALEGGPLGELIIGDVEPFEVGEGVFLAEAGEIFDSVVRQVQSSQSG